MHELLSHPQAAPRPVSFFAPAPATARFNNSTEKYRPDISLPRPAVFFAPAPGTALLTISPKNTAVPSIAA